MNQLRLLAYSSGVTEVVVPELENAQDFNFESCYPGGRYLVCSFFVPCDVSRTFLLSGGYRILARNGTSPAWEGYIASISYSIDKEKQGVFIKCVGGWGWILESRTWNKPWADNRIDDHTWYFTNSAFAVANVQDQGSIDRNGQMKFIPKGIAFGVNEYFRAVYTMPTGETIKRITGSYDMQEAAQAWRQAIFDEVGPTVIWNVDASGTGSIDVSPTARQTFSAYFQALAGQTPTEDGTYYGNFTDLVVYSETGNIDALEIGKDVIGKETRLNSATGNILSTATFSLIPFVTNGYETLASILTRAASFGDASGGAMAFYLRESDFAAAPDGKPVLVLEAQPALSDYDYAIRIDEENLTGPLNLDRDFYGVRNWIIVSYKDLNGRIVYVTPDDDATLTDSSSVASYGQRDLTINTGQSTEAAAVAWGVRILAKLKDPKFYVSGPITVKEYIRAKEGNNVPVSLVAPGKRIKVENFLTDLVGSLGAGLTFLISHIGYDDKTQTASISCGVSDNLAVFLARLEFGNVGGIGSDGAFGLG